MILLYTLIQVKKITLSFYLIHLYQCQYRTRLYIFNLIYIISYCIFSLVQAIKNNHIIHLGKEFFHQLYIKNTAILFILNSKLFMV